MHTFSPSGWERLTNNTRPALVAARRECLKWLSEVPKRYQSSWDNRLKSKLDHPHLSVRLELYLHQFFKDRGWKIEIEPQLRGTTSSPDFVLSRGGYTVMVEAKTVLDSKLVTEQHARLMQLADGLGKRLGQEVLIHPLSNLPPSGLPNKDIAAKIRKQAGGSRLNEEFRVIGKHQGHEYELDVMILSHDDDSESIGSVGAIIGKVHTVTNHSRIRKAIVDKARKYGVPEVPLVIAIWPNLSFYREDDDISGALWRDKKWLLGPSKGNAVEDRDPNGVFTMLRGGSPRYPHVSAVAVYRFEYDLSPPHTGNHLLRVYHNPYASYPLDIDVFQGVPQFVLDRSTDSHKSQQYNQSS